MPSIKYERNIDIGVRTIHLRNCTHMNTRSSFWAPNWSFGFGVLCVYSAFHIKFSGKSISNLIFNGILIGNGVRDGNPHRICGPGWPGTPQKVELVGSEQNPRTGSYYYFIKKSVLREITHLMGSNHRPPCPKWWNREEFSCFHLKLRFAMVFCRWKTTFAETLCGCLITSYLHVP